MKYRPPWGPLRPLDRNRAAEINVVYSSRQAAPSLRLPLATGPRAFYPPRLDDTGIRGPSALAPKLIDGAGLNDSTSAPTLVRCLSD